MLYSRKKIKSYSLFKNITFLSIFLVMFTSCGLFTYRSYESQMRLTDNFWVPNRDFPVVAGDTGRAYRSRRDIWKRTPRGKRSSYAYNLDLALKDQLIGLEDSLTEREYRYYLKYKDFLKSDSEKIYFLQLPNRREKINYIYSRGILTSDRQESSLMNRAVGQKELIQGMSKDDVIRSWGRPMRVDVAGNPTLQNERWAFMRRGQVHYVFFEEGRVQGWSQ